MDKNDFGNNSVTYLKNLEACTNAFQENEIYDCYLKLAKNYKNDQFINNIQNKNANKNQF